MMSILHFVLIFVLSYGATANHSLKAGWADISNSCVCQNYACGCCLFLNVPKIGLNDTGCVNVTYLPKSYIVSFTMTIDKRVIFNETFSARNPPPFCVGLPYLEKLADLCLRFYDLNITKSSAHGCIELEARLNEVVVAYYKFGCFNLVSSEVKQIYTKRKETIIFQKKETYIPKVFLNYMYKWLG